MAKGAEKGWKCLADLRDVFDETNPNHRRRAEELADAGDVEMMAFTGEMYLLGRRHDYDKAHLYLNRAAMLGDAYSAYLLAEMELKGLGCEADAESAARHLAEVAERVPAAKYRLGMMHLEGAMEGADPEEAFRIMTELSKQDHAKAFYTLGYMYLNGIGVKKNEHKGSVMVHRAAELGDEMAIKAVGPQKKRKLGLRGPRTPPRSRPGRTRAGIPASPSSRGPRRACTPSARASCRASPWRPSRPRSSWPSRCTTTP